MTNKPGVICFRDGQFLKFPEKTVHVRFIYKNACKLRYFNRTPDGIIIYNLHILVSLSVLYRIGDFLVKLNYRLLILESNGFEGESNLGCKDIFTELKIFLVGSWVSKHMQIANDLSTAATASSNVLQGILPSETWSRWIYEKKNVINERNLLI